VDAETLVSSSVDGTVRFWSVATGAQKEELDGGSFAFSGKVPGQADMLSKNSSSGCPDKLTCFSSEQTVGKYRITFKDNLLFISEGQSVVAFFRAPRVISTIESAGERIGVVCKNGEVLELRADWLV